MTMGKNVKKKKKKYCQGLNQVTKLMKLIIMPAFKTHL